jgi:cysteine desulfurase
MNKAMYFDYAAATPVLPAVAAAMKPYADELFYNPSGLSLASRQIRADVKKARSSIARWLTAQPAEIVFTAGGTEANNLAIHGLLQNYPHGHVVATNIEHDSVLQPLKLYDHTLVPVATNGIIDPRKLNSSISDKTVLVSVMYVNNELGGVQPIREIAQIVQNVKTQRQKQKNKTPLFLHTDACQAANYLNLYVDELGVDMMTINAGKIYGPKQAGCLYVRKNVPLQPIIHGGGQERGLRSGTENIAHIVGFARALQIAQSDAKKETKRLQQLQQLFFTEVGAKISKVVANGSMKHRIANNIHITIPGTDNERILMELDERGIIGASGSACSARKEDVSHVLSAIGLSEPQARASLRLSMGRYTTQDHIHALVSALAEVAQ